MSSKELQLRDYQHEIINEARAALAEHKKIMVMAPTAAGKTILATYMVKIAMSKGLRIGFLVETMQLIDQTVSTFGQYGIPCGVIQAQNPLYDPSQQVQVCSIQTLARRSYDPFDFLIVDEAHVLMKKTKELIEESQFVVGLSATPYRKELGRYYKKLVAPVRMNDLIKNGFLSGYRVYGPSTINTDGLRTVSGDFVKRELAERADKPKITGDIVEHWLKYGKGRKTICFCVNVAHGKHVAAEFNRRGVKAVEVNSYQCNDGVENERKQMMDSFVKGDAEVICSVNILGKGFDFPDVSCAIMARPTKSMMVHQQQLGRAVRVGGGWGFSLILDHAGNFERLGFPEDYNFTELDDGTKSASERKKKEQKEKLPKPCPSCDYMKPAGEHKCAACGFEPENIRDVETQDGELEELKRAKSDRKKYSIKEKQEFMGGLNTYAKEKKYKRSAAGNYGWSINKYKEKFNCLPSSKVDWGFVCEVNEDVKTFIQHCNIRFAKSKKGKEWAEQNRVKETNHGCKACGCVLMKKEFGLWGPHTVKQSCSNCGSFFKWGSN